MKILSAQQIRDWDKFTIRHEPIASIDLMERAAEKCFQWLEQNNYLNNSISIFCGKGNNGGDGLALARLLAPQTHVKVYILETGSEGTADFQSNLERLHHAISFIKTEKNFPSFSRNEIIVDALFGSGLNRPLDGIAAKLVEHLNKSGPPIISIDLPSGLPADDVTKGIAVRGDHILSFQSYKLSFLLPANADFVGDVHVLDIGLSKSYEQNLETDYELIDKGLVRSIYKPRNRFAHKGNFGHALLIAGGYGKMGAAVLAARASLRAGAGLTTVHIPRAGYAILQSAVPEAMVSSDPNSYVVTKIEEDLARFSCIGIGPGIGTASETKEFLHQLFKSYGKPLVIDADALNLIAADKDLLAEVPGGSVLTPHPKEFERLFGKTESDLASFDLARQKAKQHNVVIVLKGHHSFIATPGGKAYFNSTGNAGLAKGGSGDVLTGVITALMGQYKDNVEAAMIGVYLHGLAADLAARNTSQEALTAGDVIENLGQAFKEIN